MSLFSKTLVIICALVCLGLNGIDSAYAVPAFPLNPGSSWTYRDLEGNLETMVIKGIIHSKGIPLIEASYDDLRSYYYILSEDGLFRLQPSGDTTSDTPFGELTLLAQWPMEPGRTWQSPWSDPPLSFEVLHRGSVKVAAGIFPNSVKIGYRPLDNPIFAGIIWINPEVGILVHEQSGYRSELVSYSLSNLLPPAEIQLDGSRLANILKPVRPGSGKKPQLSISERFFNWLSESGIPFGFFLLLLTLFFSVIFLIMRSRRVEIDLSDDYEVIEGETTLASAMVREGLYDEAIRILLELTARHPQWPDVAALLGKAYRNTGKLEEACLELKRALTFNPNMSSTRLELVRVYLDLEDPARALNEVDSVLTENGQFADALYLRGEALRIMGKDELALEAYREALAINPDFQQAQEGLEKVLSELPE